MSKMMLIGPNQAADLRNTGRWDPDTMTTDKALADASKAGATEAAENSPMRPPIRSEIILSHTVTANEMPETVLREHPEASANNRIAGARRMEWEPQPSISEIARQLNDRAEDVAREVLGKPNATHSSKQQLRFGTKGSLAIEIDGPKCGRWYDHENGHGGDALELVMREKRIALGEALQWARRWLNMASSNASPGPQLSQDDSDSQSSEDDAEAKRLRVQKVLSSSVGTSGTPAELYLRNRAITEVPPNAVRYRARACGRYGALVALATDINGDVLAVQQVYLTHDGRKAPVKVVKQTYKAVERWSEKAAMRLAGEAPIILCEGPETALSVWQATGREVWCCFGIANIARAPLPDQSAVVVARDGDEPGSKADKQIYKTISLLTARGYRVSVATPPSGDDFNDVLVKKGAEAVRELIGAAQPAKPPATSDIWLDIGSDVEIANKVSADITAQFGPILHSEGTFWRYGATHWERVADDELRRAVHKYDGAYFPTERGVSRVKLSKSRIDSVLNEFAALCESETFFGEGPTGINCKSGFIRFSQDGSPSLEPHDREHRCRHTLPGSWVPGSLGKPPENSLLHRLLEGIFWGDEDAAAKTALLAAIAGSAALGYATKLKQPRAAVLWGQTAENGKSQILDLIRRLLPENAICSVPAARMGDERHIIGLAGKLLNATDELSADAVASDTFKSVVTGEPIEGRDVYKSRIEFRPIAQNLFATNNLPPFKGGMDRGVQRRLLVIPFNRTIPMEERIENIGRRIGEEEPDLLLAWAIEGAARLIRERNFSIPDSSKRALADWIFGADPVLAWLEECVEVGPIDSVAEVSSRHAFEQFQSWAIGEGYRKDTLSGINGFVQRVKANKAGVLHHRTGEGRFFQGMVLRQHGVGSQSAAIPF